MRIAVIGGGYVGFSTAVCIQRCLPTAVVSVVTDRLSPDTTGDVAAGSIVPHAPGKTSFNLIKKWTEQTQEHLSQLLWKQNKRGETYGIQLLPLLLLNPKEGELPPEHTSLLANPHKVDDKFLNMLHKVSPQLSTYPNITQYDIIVCDGSLYLPELQAEFHRNGGQLVRRKVHAFEELINEADIIVNCTGVGARALCNDHRLRPMRGQVVCVKAPTVRYAFEFADRYDTYIIPRGDIVVLGGSHELDNWDLKPNEKLTKEIVDRAAEMIPALKNAPIVAVKVGLRPFRDEIRLEVEQKVGLPPIVHNYGHGGSGVTIHWGCAMDAAKLVLQQAKSMQAKL